MSNAPAPSKRTTAKKTPPAEKALTSARIIQELVAGRHDAKLLEIATAIAVRVRETGTTFAWRFHLDDLDVGEYELTVDEWEAVESITEKPWGTTNPDPANGGSIRDTRAVTTVLLEHRGGVDRAVAAQRVSAMTLVDLEQLFTSEQRSAPLSSPS
jgi:hypothetical protein